jgi:hypothetical protein
MLKGFLFHYALPIIMYTKSVYDSLTYEFTYYYDTLKKSLTSNELIFFENNPNAYLRSHVNTVHKCSGLVTWTYNIYNNMFYSYNCAFKDTKHFPILSASLICDSEIINLDNFFEETKIQASNPGFPTLQQVIEVYTYKTGIVFDRMRPWKLSILDSSVNEYMLNIFKDSWPFTENPKN